RAPWALRPQQVISPARRSAHENPPPALTPTAWATPSTTTAPAGGLPGGAPNWPWRLLPQQRTCPPTVTAQVWALPADKLTNCFPTSVTEPLLAPADGEPLPLERPDTETGPPPP